MRLEMEELAREVGGYEEQIRATEEAVAGLEEQVKKLQETATASKVGHYFNRGLVARKNEKKKNKFNEKNDIFVICLMKPQRHQI